MKGRRGTHPDSQSIIYAISRSSDDAIKLGRTIGIFVRLRALRREARKQGWGELTLLSLRSGGHDEEKKLHYKWADLRINPRLEWFEPTEELLEAIAAWPQREIPDTYHRYWPTYFNVEPLTPQAVRLYGADPHYRTECKWDSIPGSWTTK